MVPHDSSLETLYRREQKLIYFCSRKYKEISDRNDKVTFSVNNIILFNEGQI